LAQRERRLENRYGGASILGKTHSALIP